MNLDKDELTIIGTICAWVLAVAHFGWKGGAIVSRVEVLESDNQEIKTAMSLTQDEVTELSKRFIELSREVRSISDLISLKLENINKTLVDSKVEFNGHQDRTTKTLESFVLMHTQTVDQIDRLREKIYSSQK